MGEHPDESPPRFPVSAGLLLGVGLGGFFDGIVLHQLLQWHHMVTSAGYPPDTVANLQFNTLLDGLFHTFTYLCVAAGVGILWHRARQPHARWPGHALWSTLLAGFAAFNIVEGLVDHHWLELHHVNETVPEAQWVYWDVGFLVLSVLMLLVAAVIYRRGTMRSSRASR